MIRRVIDAARRVEIAALYAASRATDPLINTLHRIGDAAMRRCNSLEVEAQRKESNHGAEK